MAALRSRATDPRKERGAGVAPCASVSPPMSPALSTDARRGRRGLGRLDRRRRRGLLAALPAAAVVHRLQHRHQLVILERAVVVLVALLEVEQELVAQLALQL